MSPFTASIETDAGTYQHGFHLGTDERVARELIEELCDKRVPKIGTRVVSVALIQNGMMLDCYGCGYWSSDCWEDLEEFEHDGGE